MADLVDGIWLQQYVAPQLLEEFRNYKDDFIGTFTAPDPEAIDKDGIRFNKLINEIKFYVNKSTAFNPITIGGKKSLVLWDKLDTDVTAITDKQARALAFDMNSSVRKMHNDAFRIGVRDYAMQKIAPVSNTSGTPIIRTTGANDGGRKKLLYADLVNYYKVLEGLNLNDWTQAYMILCPEHRQDLIDDRSNTNNYRDIEIDPVTGAIKRFFKLKFFENNQTVKFRAGDIPVPDGGAAQGTDRNGSLFYYAPNIVHHIEAVTILYKELTSDTRNPDPQSEIRLHTYGLTDKKQEYGVGALVSGIAS